MSDEIDRRPSHWRKPWSEIRCECGARVLENDLTGELVHVGDCGVVLLTQEQK